MFRSLFPRFPQGKTSVFTDVKELNEEHIYLFTMTPLGTIVHNSWKFQMACISLNTSRPLNPIKLKCSPCLRYIWSYRSVTSLMDVTFIGSAPPKLWYLLLIFWTHSKDTWLGLSTDIFFDVKEGFDHIVKWWNMELVGLFPRENKKIMIKLD